MTDPLAQIRFRFGDDRRIWLGLKEKQMNEWTSTVDGRLITFNRFQSKNPGATVSSNTHCGGMDLDQGEWKIKNCDMEMNFVCRKERGRRIMLECRRI